MQDILETQLRELVKNKLDGDGTKDFDLSASRNEVSKYEHSGSENLSKKNLVSKRRYMEDLDSSIT